MVLSRAISSPGHYVFPAQIILSSKALKSTSKKYPTSQDNMARESAAKKIAFTNIARRFDHTRLRY